MRNRKSNNEARLSPAERARREQIRQLAYGWKDPGWGWEEFHGPDVEGLAEAAIRENRSVASFRETLRRLRTGGVVRR